MKILDRYIFRKFVGTFIYAIGIMALISCVIDYSEKVADFVKNQAPASAILFYYLTFIPHITALLFPLFIFIAAIFFTSRLAYRSEIIAMLATGMSFTRFLRPYVYGAVFLGTISLGMNHFLIPIANKYRLKFEDRYYKNKVVSSDENVHLKLSKDLLVYVQSYNYEHNTGNRFIAEKIDGNELKERLIAQSFSYDSVKKEWLLRNAFIRKINGLHEQQEYVPELTRLYPFTPKDLRVNLAIKEALTTPQLNEYIALQQRRGNSSLNFYRIEKHRRTAQPFAALILTIIGACIASRKVRGGSGLHLALGIVISALYVMAMQFTNTFSTNAGFSPFIATWIPNVIFGLVALVLYRRQVR